MKKKGATSLRLGGLSASMPPDNHIAVGASIAMQQKKHRTGSIFASSGSIKELAPSAVSGTFLFLSLASFYIFITISGGLQLFPGKNAATHTKFSESALFTEELASCDKLLAAAFDAPSLARPRLLASRLDRLDSLAESAERRVQVLKRRRSLAKKWPQYAADYKTAALKHAASFPASPILAAIAAEALIMSGQAAEAAAFVPALSNAANLERGGEYAALCYETAAISGLLSSLDSVTNMDAASKTAIKGVFSILSAASTDQNALSYGVLLNLTENSGRGAQEEASLLAAAAASPASSGHFLRFAASYNYDFGAPLTAARLYERLPKSACLSMAASAYALAGNIQAAQPLWRSITDAHYEKDAPQGTGEGTLLAARYNLAQSGEAAQLETLLTEAAASSLPARLETRQAGTDPLAADAYIYGMIRYTRLQERVRALAILEASPLAASVSLLDLEALRRQLPAEPRERTLPLTWLLAGRHPEDEQVCEWAAWYFDYCRAWEESALLLARTEKFHTGGQWLIERKALTAMREGRLEEAINLFTSLQDPPWEANANLGLIYEAMRNWKTALSFYTAASIKSAFLRKERSRLELSRARCQEALGNTREARTLAESALTIDSENLNAYTFLQRLRSN